MSHNRYYKAKQLENKVTAEVLGIIKDCKKPKDLPVYYESWVYRLHCIRMLVLDLKYQKIA